MGLTWKIVLIIISIIVLGAVPYFLKFLHTDKPDAPFIQRLTLEAYGYVALVLVLIFINIVVEVRNHNEGVKKDAEYKKNHSELLAAIEKKGFRYDTATKELSSITNITGKNINTGTNTGIIGDIINERELNEEGKRDLLKWVDLTKRKYNPSTNCVFVYTTNTSNGGRVSAQIYDYLKELGFEMRGKGTLYNTVKGVAVGYSEQDKCLEITVGDL